MLLGPASEGLPAVAATVGLDARRDASLDDQPILFHMLNQTRKTLTKISNGLRRGAGK
jgi:hypothetical protein